jgi:hypothetical protein
MYYFQTKANVKCTKHIIGNISMLQLVSKYSALLLTVEHLPHLLTDKHYTIQEASGFNPCSKSDEGQGSSLPSAMGN